MIIKGDIHEEIKKLEDNSIDLIYTDPPFGTTKAEWDKPLDWEKLFIEMWRVLKEKGVIVLYASMPFSYELIKYEKPKYNYTWIKSNSTNFFAVSYQPLRQTEEIFIYYKTKGKYNPQMIGNKFYPKRKVKVGGKNQNYYGKDMSTKNNEYVKEEGHYGNYPDNVLNYPIRKDHTGITRTDEHIDYFIKTYSNEGDDILDMTCCNNYVSNRAEILKRNYIGIDLNPVFV